MKVIIYIFAIALFLVNVCQLALAIDKCRTPRNANGDCKIITECEPLDSLLRRRPISGASAEFLRQSQCGFEGTLPKVCCPLEPYVSSTTAQPLTTQANVNQNNNNNQNSNNDAGSSTSVNNRLLPSTDVCGISTQDRIVGGEATDLDEFPWMALIEYEKPNRDRGFYCGGVLISNRYILTAAHCVKGKDLPKSWKLVSVRLGEYDTDTEKDCIDTGYGVDCAPAPQNVAVEERIAHEDYNPYDKNQAHDIALLRLKRPVQYTEFVKPICLPLSADDRSKNFVGQRLFVAGWGKTENSSSSNVKLKVQVPVKSLNDCTSTYKQARVNLADGQLCAGGEKGYDSCRGDSGGPLMTLNFNKARESNWYAAGVVSFGPTPCGMENWPGVYTKVSNYMEWIAKNVKA